MTLTELFLQATLTSLRTNKGLADKAIAQVPDDRLHISLDTHTNSLAVIMKHVAGNLRSRWTDFLTSDGEKPWRDRDAEFTEGDEDRVTLNALWETGWSCFFGTLEALRESDLAQTVTIRGEAHPVPLAIQRSLAHTTYHVGQIVQVARILAGETWTVLTIPRGASAAHNQRVWGLSDYRDRAQ